MNIKLNKLKNMILILRRMRHISDECGRYALDLYIQESSGGRELIPLDVRV